MNDKCIEWSGAKTTLGYGSIFVRDTSRHRNRRHLYAHRWAYEKFFGPIPAGMMVLHSCDNPPCINPLHLRVGVSSDNVSDMVTRGRAWPKKKTVCLHGHPLSGDNLVASDLRIGIRRCRICHAARCAKWYRGRNREGDK